VLLNAQQSALIVVDIQEKLINKIMHHEMVVQSSVWLMELAKTLDVPVVLSEQYPKGLGPSVPEIKAKSHDVFVEKTAFSVAGDVDAAAKIKALDKKQLVLCGIETAVCVLQTALLFKEQGYDIFVVGDAVGSRHILDHEIALSRLCDAGVHVVTREMVLFEWLRDAAHPSFKAVSQQFLRG